MNVMITPAEVVALAFGCGSEPLCGEITEATIVAAERKYLVPVFGAEMVENMKSGGCQELVVDYVKPALALYVKRLVLRAWSATWARGLKRWTTPPSQGSCDVLRPMPTHSSIELWRLLRSRPTTTPTTAQVAMCATE